MALRDFLLFVLVCVIWGSNTVLSKLVIGGMGVPPLAYAAVRFALVSLVTWPWLLPAPKPLGRVVVVALLMGAVGFAPMFIGLRTASPSGVAVVNQLGVPMMVVLSMLILGETINWRRGLGIGLTFGGVMLAVWRPSGFSPSGGLLLVALSTFAAALGAVLMKQVQGVKPLQFQAWVGFTAVAPLAALSALSEHGQLSAMLRAGWPFVGAVACSALLVSVFAHTLYYKLISRNEANVLAALGLMTPLATIALGVLFTHDRIDARTAVGTAIALIGVLVVAVRGARALQWMQRLRNLADGRG